MTTRGVDTHPELTAAVDALPEGPDTVALFDFDGTLMHGYSAVAFLREQLRRGDFSAKQFVFFAKTQFHNSFLRSARIKLRYPKASLRAFAYENHRHPKRIL